MWAKLKNKFADEKTKVFRICQESGKREKLEAVLEKNPEINLNEMRSVCMLLTLFLLYTELFNDFRMAGTLFIWHVYTVIQN